METYHDLQSEHTAWVQRIHAVLFHQGAPAQPGMRAGKYAGRPGPRWQRRT